MTPADSTERPSHTARARGAAAALVVDGLAFTYRGGRRRRPILALAGVTLAIPAGQSVALLGPNGSGKSTLMQIIGGLLQPARGRVEVFGDARPVAARRELGVVFQHDALDPNMTVWENLRDQAMLYGRTRREARDHIERELDAAGLADRRDTPVSTLSRGLARRVDLLRALLHRPRLVLLDEPTVGLDPSAREAFLRQLEERREAHDLTILMSTHLVDEADRQDRVVLMHEGRIIADGAPAALRRAVGRRRVTVLDADWTPPQTPHAEAWRRARGGWSAVLERDDEAQRLVHDLLTAGVPLTVAPPTLADVFAQRTQASLAAGDDDNPSAADEVVR